jgi:Mg-chelatase subunit ChlD
MTPDAMANAKSAAATYIDKLKAVDQVGVIQFDDQVEILASVSTDKVKAKNAVNSITPRGDTALYDALQESIQGVPDCGRKAVTVLTDGNDTASKNGDSAIVIQKANEANLPIFSVGIKGSQFNPSVIRSISESTGGQYLEANTPSEISAIYEKIDGQLTGQFVANLKLSTAKNGQIHKLKIVSTVKGSATSSERTFKY